MELIYTKLKRLLVEEKWREADLETAFIMQRLCGHGRDYKLSRQDIENFPCEPLSIINECWGEYSNGYFGFNVQNCIWQEVKRDYFAFCEHVGWRENSKWLQNDLPSPLNVPEGHLPRLWDFPAFRQVSPSSIESLFLRVETCGL